jgi:hypothetical protein
MTTVLVAGALANKYGHGGEAWVRLNWILGLKKLGFDVFFVEHIAGATCLDTTGAVAPFERSVNRAYFEAVTEEFGLQGRAALIYEDGTEIYGLSREEILARADDAKLLVNISGHLDWEPLLSRCRRKAYIDIDPGFTQFWHAQGNLGARLGGHDYYFTIGENIGTSGCCIPTSGIPWRPTRPPVVLEHWPVTDTTGPDRFTTVASWRGPFGPVQHEGQTFGLKVHQFRKFVELPSRAPYTFEIALNIHPADSKDLALLQSHGWRIVDPRTAGFTPDAFRRYLQTSGAEFSVAQGIYVETSSGWFSDRTVHYLASGKPVLVQDTGFGRSLPTGAGLVPFRTLDEAVQGAERMMANYSRHARAARGIAESHFDSDKVLGRLVAETGVAP